MKKYILILLFSFSVFLLKAITIPNGNWDGSASSDWNTGNNWGLNALPWNTTTVSIGSPGTYTNAPVVNGAVSYNTVNLTDGGVLTNNADFTVNTNFNFTGSSNLKINRGLTSVPALTMPNTSRIDLDGGTLEVRGVLTVQSGALVEITNGILDVQGLTIQNGGSVTCTGGSTINISGNWNNQSLTASGGFTESTSTVNFDGGGAQSISHSGGTETFSALTISGSSTVTVNPHLVFNNLNIGSGSTIVATAAKNITVNGNWTDSNGGGSGFTPSTSTVIFNKAGAQALSRTTGTENFYNLTLASTSSLTINPDIVVSNNLTIGNGTTVIASAAKTITIGGNWIDNNGAGTGFTPSTSTVVFNKAGAQALSRTTGTENFYNLTLASTSSLTINPDIVVSNNLTIGNGTTVIASAAKTLTIGGNWIDNNGAGTGFTPSTSTVVFNKAGAQALSRTTGTENFYNLTLASTSSLTINPDIVVSNNLTIGNGTTVIASAAKTLTIGGNWIDNNGAGTGFTPSTSTVVFNKAGAQALSRTTGTENFYNLTLASTSVLTVNPDISTNNIVIGNGATLAPAAGKTITVGGDWSNNNLVSTAGFTEGTSTVVFNKSGAQSIDHAGAKEAFYNFTISNSGNVVSLNCNLDVLNNLDFITSGYVDVQDKELTMVNWVDGKIPNLAADRFVIATTLAGGAFVIDGVDAGEIVQAIVGLAPGSSNFTRVDLANNDASANQFSVNVCNSISTDGTCAGTLHTDSVVNVTWNITSASTDCGVTFYWDTSNELADLDRDSLAVSHYKDGKWNWLSDPVAASLYSGTIYKVGGTTDGFSPFGVGAADPSDGTPGPLPVELISFELEEVGGYVNLLWSTAAEINNDYFILERSEDGQFFNEIDYIKGVGNSSERNNYRYIDMNVIAKKYYYRLKQVDFDGAYEYSSVIIYSKQEEMKLFGIDLYPNIIESGNSFNLILEKLSNIQNDLEIQIYNSEGLKVFAQKISFGDVQNGSVPIRLQSAAKGIYFVTVYSGQNVNTKKLIVR